MNKKGILVCAGGMSTQMIKNKLNEVNDIGMTFDAMGVTGTNWQQDIAKYDVVLVSPQIRFQYNDIKAEGDKVGVVVIAIPPLLYNPIKVPELWEIVKKEIK